MRPTKWDKRYLNLAKEVALWSKDPSRKIGAVAVGEKGQVLAQGYNGFPRGIQDNSSRYENRETKYKFIVHAEMNLIYNAGYNGTSLDGSSIYVYGLPVCSECAKGLIQVGAKNVIIGIPLSFDEQPDVWKESWELTTKMFNEAGVNFKIIELNHF